MLQRKAKTVFFSLFVCLLDETSIGLSGLGWNRDRRVANGEKLLTPWNVSIASKNILVFLYNCYGIFLSIATSVEVLSFPAM